MKEKPTFFVVGERNQSYARTAVLIRALSEVFITLVTELPKPTFFAQWNYVRSLTKGITKKSYLVILYPAERMTWAIVFARLFFRGTLVVDTFISSYDSFVNDRALAHPYGPKALYYSLLDQMACYFADILLFDTKEHEAYFRRRYFLRSKTRTLIIPISLDLEQIDQVPPSYSPLVRERPGKFFVLFFGNYIPLQGVQYILNAFALLPHREDFHLLMVGNGQTRGEAMVIREALGLSDVEFVARLPHHEVLALAKKADLALGIFGDTEKATRVIPNKLLEAMACNVPVITGRNTATEEYFRDGEEVLYCRLGDAPDLAKTITRAQHDDELRTKVKKNARLIIEKEFSLERLIGRLGALSNNDDLK